MNPSTGKQIIMKQAPLDIVTRNRIMTGRQCPRCDSADIHFLKWDSFRCGECREGWETRDFLQTGANRDRHEIP